MIGKIAILATRLSVGGLLTLVISAAQIDAFAVDPPPQSCIGNQKNEQATTGGHPKGIRATTAVADWMGDCFRVVSVAVSPNVDPTASVEFGWSLGYATNNNGTCCTYFPLPELFQHWRAVNASTATEHNIRSLTSQTQVTLTLQDGDGNGIWTAWTGVDGADLEGLVMNVDFATGTVITNSERHTSCEPSGPGVCDAAWSHDWNEKRWLTGNSDFTAWLSDAAGPLNNDPWYYYDHTTDHEHYIRLCSTAGC